MGLTIWVAPSGTLETLSQGAGGGHFWAYFNWVLGLRALGHRVVWLEWVSAEFAVKHLGPLVSDFERLLHGYGVTLAIEPATEGLVSREVSRRCIGLEAAEAADLLFNFHYALPRDVVAAFRRSALVDIDPGLLQIWITEGQLDVAPHDRYLTIGETIGRPGSRCPDAGLVWHYTSLPVCLDEWRPTPAPAAAPYTTVSNWWGQWVLWQGQAYANDKRTYFMEFAELPQRTSASLELALYLGDGDEGDRAHLERNGWTIRSVLDVCQTPFDYRRYIQRSRGEFSCVKPSCVRLDNAWISDRSVCYLASGKPVVVQYTGASQFLPDACGFFRFRTIEEAAHHLETVEANYERHCREARALAEEYFDARTVLTRALELALD